MPNSTTTASQNQATLCLLPSRGRSPLPYVSPSPSTREGCQKVAGGRSGRKGADHRIDARVATHPGEVPETALPVWELVSLPAQKAVVWHPNRMQTDRRPRTGGRSPCHPGTTTGYLLPTLPGWAEAQAPLTPSSISPLKGNLVRDRDAAQRATPERPGRSSPWWSRRFPRRS
jgi:hypothetical protein